MKYKGNDGPLMSFCFFFLMKIEGIPLISVFKHVITCLNTFYNLFRQVQCVLESFNTKKLEKKYPLSRIGYAEVYCGIFKLHYYFLKCTFVLQNLSLQYQLIQMHLLKMKLKFKFSCLFSDMTKYSNSVGHHCYFLFLTFSLSDGLQCFRDGLRGL